MKILLLSDIHLSERPPSSCTDSYCDDLFDLLSQARQVGFEYDVAAMVWAGDTFHHKAPGRVTHRLVQRTCDFISTCTKYFPVLILAGNHDMANDRYESIFESQPLGLLYRAGARPLVRGSAFGLDVPVYGVPWLQGYGNWGAWEGDGPHPPIEANLGAALDDYRHWVHVRGTGQHRPLVVAHAPLYPPGKELEYEYFPAGRWSEAMGHWRNGGDGYVFYGHVHEPHGTYGEYGSHPEGGDWSVTFCNNGALSRGSLHEYNLTRQVGVTLFDTEDGTFEFVPLDAKPASEVFRLAEKGKAAVVQEALDDFLRRAGTTSLEVMSVESVIAHVRSLGIGAEAEALAEELLTEAQGAGTSRKGD